MGASARKDKLDIMVSTPAFYDRTGIVSDYQEIEWLGFELDNLVGIFSQEDLPELLIFCKENPAYHIITCTAPGRLVNKYLPGHKCYRLASGDRNPNLVLNWCLDPMRPLIHEKLICEALTVLDDFKNRYKT